MNEGFVDQRIRKVLDHLTKEHGQLSPPVNPRLLTTYLRVLSVEQRKMIPEGVLCVVQGGFRIYLQSNFADQPGFRVRQRFTLAHELAHTLFYDISGPLPKLVKGAPRGEKLERLCQLGAAKILVPEPLLLREIKKRGLICTVDNILELARLFDVSSDVMIRRAHSVQSVAAENFAAVLAVESRNGDFEIRSACYRPWLRCHAQAPRAGSGFSIWSRPILAGATTCNPNEWSRNTSNGLLLARKVAITARSFIFEITLKS